DREPIGHRRPSPGPGGGRGGAVRTARRAIPPDPIDQAPPCVVRPSQRVDRCGSPGSSLAGGTPGTRRAATGPPDGRARTGRGKRESATPVVARSLGRPVRTPRPSEPARRDL